MTHIHRIPIALTVLGLVIPGLSAAGEPEHRTAIIAAAKKPFTISGMVGEAAKEAVDPVWQRARQKVYSPQDPMSRGARGLPGEPEKMDFGQFQQRVKTFTY
jgi:hypothetical protein